MSDKTHIKITDGLMTVSLVAFYELEDRIRSIKKAISDAVEEIDEFGKIVSEERYDALLIAESRLLELVQWRNDTDIPEKE